MPTIQQQINTLDQTILDLESSPSGVLAYLTQYTIDQYDNSVNNIITLYEERATELDEEIVAASGTMRIIKMGITILSATS